MLSGDVLFAQSAAGARPFFAIVVSVYVVQYLQYVLINRMRGLVWMKLALPPSNTATCPLLVGVSATRLSFSMQQKSQFSKSEKHISI